MCASGYFQGVEGWGDPCFLMRDQEGSILLETSVPPAGVSESGAVRLAESPNGCCNASRQEVTSDIIFGYVVTV